MRPFIPFISVIVIVVAILIFNPFLSDNTIDQNQDQLATDSEVFPDPSSQSAIASEELQQEAENYVSKLSDIKGTPLNADAANDFISPDQSISLGNNQEIEEMTLEQLNQTDLDKTAPITLVQEKEEIVYKTSEQILLAANNDLNKTVKILEKGEMIVMSIADLLVKYPLDEIENIAVIEKVENYIITSAEEIQSDPSISADQMLRIIKKPYTLETTSIGELLMGEKEFSSDTIFYVRKIDKNDQYGIWGVIQNGLVSNFARGIAIKRGEAIEKYQIAIPDDADELEADQSSSFLGQLIQKKSRESYVYNFEKGKMGHNPDLIYPGQELVIISFSPKELTDIYQHFVANARH